ncbi:sensor histidine kinase [Georgenia phoenicis]|uniref:sensor histidine kinase n=1 Tax=unclassified Georgenia TaxID=2626815 RepID=UPI0039B005E3
MSATAVPRGSTGEVDPRLVDAVLAMGMALVVAIVIIADLAGTSRSEPAAYLFASGFGALVLARRRAPVAVLAVTVLGIFVYYSLGLPPIGIALPAVAALYSAAEVGRTWWAVGAGVVLVSVAAYFRIREGMPAAYLLSYDLLTNVALVAAAVALGVSVRDRRAIRAHEERVRALIAAEHAREAERRLQEERIRIARDLHDVVGHTISVIAVHGSVAAEAIGRDDATAARAVDRIRQVSSETMRELRSTVKLLRSPAAQAERDAVGLAGIPGLVAAAHNAGLDVDLELDVDPGRLDGAIESAAYRIVQESLTNVIRHSGGRHARVVARITDGRLLISVTDDGHGTAASRGHATGGQGILGMRERAALLGGSLQTHDGDQGGFVVRADLPARLP